jgi:hypothetical protein
MPGALWHDHSTHFVPRFSVSKKSRSSQKASPASGAAKAPGWFERLKRLRLRLRFKRQGLNIHMLLEDPAEHIAEIKRESAVADTSEAAMMSKALKKVLDRHASSRTVLAHLALLEKSLNRRGLKALDQLPPEVMQRAMSQLETLVTDWSQTGLAALRARVTSALIEHQRAGKRRHAKPAERLSNFQDSQRLEVNEASLSTFTKVNALWGRSLTGSLPPGK